MIDRILNWRPAVPEVESYDRQKASGLRIAVREKQSGKVIEGRGIDFYRYGVGIMIPSLSEEFYSDATVLCDIRLAGKDEMSARRVTGRLCYSRKWDEQYRIGIQFSFRPDSWSDSKIRERVIAIEEELAAMAEIVTSGKMQSAG